MHHSPFEAPRLSLEYERKRAKRLCKQLHANEPEALAWYHRLRPARENFAQPHELRLADVQWLLARDYGLPDWKALTDHIRGLESHRRRLDIALDTPDTLHIRCGSDIRDGLRLAGFQGDFLEFSDPYCQGPLLRDNLIAQRSHFIAETYGLPLAEVEARQQEAYRELARAWDNAAQVVLWFEHDSYDQLILAYILSRMPQAGLGRTSLISIDRFPGIRRFNGLGQLEPEALRSLWAQRIAVTAEMRQRSVPLWEALTDPDPRSLLAFTDAVAGLPFMPGAVVRHLQELPSLFNGLSLTQQLTLEALNLADSQTETAGKLFGRLVRELEPRPFLGDLMYFAELTAMRRAKESPFHVVGDSSRPEPWPQRRLQLSATGQQLLDGEKDWRDCHPPGRWVGGLQLKPGSRWWRWSNEGSALRLSLS